MCYSLVAWISSYLCFHNRIASTSSSSSSISRMQWIYFQCEAYLVLFDRRIGRIEQHLKNVLVYFVSLPLSFSQTIWITAIWSFISVSRSLCFIHSLSHTHEHTLTRIHSLYSVYRIVGAATAITMDKRVRLLLYPCEWWWIVQFVCVVAVVLNSVLDRVEWEPTEKTKYKQSFSLCMWTIIINSSVLNTE